MPASCHIALPVSLYQYVNVFTAACIHHYREQAEGVETQHPIAKQEDHGK